jgi:hypothetical protein
MYNNRKTYFLRHLENVLLETHILKREQLRVFKRDVADAVLFALESYEHDFYYDTVEHTSALMPVVTKH